MSDSQYQEIDLDNLGAAEIPSDIEIVEENPEVEVAEEEAPAPVAKTKAAVAEDDDDADEDSVADSDGQGDSKKKLSRSQRLKTQRDNYARQLAEMQERLRSAEERASKFEKDATEGASIGMDMYIKSIDADMQSLRREFDTAFDEGNREKIFEVQQRMAELAAEKKQAERDRRSIPTKAAAPAGQEAPQQTQQTQPTNRPNPFALEWLERNKSWFNTDPIMTAAARAVDQQMVQEGFNPTEPDYFDELDKRIRREMPHKFGEAPAPARKAAAPTVQNRAGVVPGSNGKVRVTITQADREMANHLGISITDYAREKAKRERAANTANQYTEIF